MSKTMYLEDFLAKCEEEGVFVDSVHQKQNVGQDRWHVQLRAISKHEAKAWSYFPGSGPSFTDALRQAAGNAGVISGRKDMVEEDMPQKKRKKMDLLG